MTRHHDIDYIEIPAPDLGAAKDFYGSAFGWGFIDYGPEYAGIQSVGGDGEMGGFNPQGTPGPGGPLVQLYSDDIEASHAAVVEAGGAITQEIFAFPGGRRFHFTDPAGNELGIWTDSGGLGA